MRSTPQVPARKERRRESRNVDPWDENDTVVEGIRLKNMRNADDVDGQKSATSPIVLPNERNDSDVDGKRKGEKEIDDHDDRDHDPDRVRE